MHQKEVKNVSKGLASTDKIAIGKEADGVTRNARNVRTRSSSVVARPGSVQYCNFHAAVGISGFTIKSLGEYNREYLVGNVTSYWRALVFVANSDLWYCIPEDSTTVAVKIADLSSEYVHYITLYDHLWIFNGVDDVKIWDGTTLNNAQMAAPAVKPTASVGSAGAKFCKYKFTYYSSSDPYPKESNASPIESVSACADTPNNTLSFTFVWDAQTTHIKIYRTILDASNEADTYYLLATISKAVASVPGYTYNDTTADPTSGSAYDTTDRGVPPKGYYPLWHDGRLYLAKTKGDPSIIQYSEPGKPFYFPSDNYDFANRDDGDDITGIGAIGRIRYIFKNRSIWEWSGDPAYATPLVQVERKDSSNNMNRVAIGCGYSETLASWSNSLIFRAATGDVYKLTQDSLVNISEHFTDVKNMGSSCSAFITEDNYYIIGDTYESFAYDLEKDGWVSNDDFSFNYSLVRYDNKYIIPNGDTLDRIYTGTTDKGVAFTKTIKYGYVKLADNDMEAMLRSVEVYCSTQLAFSVTILNDKNESVAGTYDATTKRYSVPAGSRPFAGRFFAVQLSWTGDTEVYGINIKYVTIGRH